MTIDEEKLMAFADGELDGSEREAVERALAKDPLLRRQVEAQRRLRTALADRFGPVADEEVPERLLALLRTEKHGNAASLSAARERRKPIWLPAWPNLGAIAAALAAGILAGQLISPEVRGPVGAENGILVAQGELAAALETQLASTQAPDAAARIGVTFADGQGRACRTFDASALSGLACRNGGNWALVMTAAPDRQATQYRQAGSSAVLQVAQEMMAGEPLDAAGERSAMQAGWKISAEPRD